MNIVVLIKQVPDTTDVRIDPRTGTLIREGVPSIINPDDKHALEEGLRIREKFGGTVTVLSMGPPQAEDALMEARAMGADVTVLISDRAFAGSDTLATSYALARSVLTSGEWDIVLGGRQAIDGDTAQIGPQTAELLGVPQVTYCIEIDIAEDGKHVTAKRALEDGYEVIETDPASSPVHRHQGHQQTPLPLGAGHSERVPGLRRADLERQGHRGQQEDDRPGRVAHPGGPHLRPRAEGRGPSPGRTRREDHEGAGAAPA